MHHADNCDTKKLRFACTPGPSFNWRYFQSPSTIPYCDKTISAFSLDLCEFAHEKFYDSSKKYFKCNEESYATDDVVCIRASRYPDGFSFDTSDQLFSVMMLNKQSDKSFRVNQRKIALEYPMLSRSNANNNCDDVDSGATDTAGNPCSSYYGNTSSC